MCEHCYRDRLACYCPATDSDLEEFWKGYEEWLDENYDDEYEEHEVSNV